MWIGATFIFIDNFKLLYLSIMSIFILTCMFVFKWMSIVWDVVSETNTQVIDNV